MAILRSEPGRRVVNRSPNMLHADVAIGCLGLGLRLNVPPQNPCVPGVFPTVSARTGVVETYFDSRPR